MGTTANGAAGFYGASWGPVPFAIGKLPHQDYHLVKVFVPVQYNTQPANPREVQAGDVPSFSAVPSVKIDGDTCPGEKPEAKQQVQLARQFASDGNYEEAVRHYRKALDEDPDDPVALNDLAWTLATASQPELRNGEEAVRLATKAVQLTHGTQPIIFGTLADAYAQTGQFPQACEMAQTARALAWMTNQKEIAEKNDKLLSRLLLR